MLASVHQLMFAPIHRVPAPKLQSQPAIVIIGALHDESTQSLPIAAAPTETKNLNLTETSTQELSLT